MTTMVMSTEEIRSDYRQAKNRQRQITILADRNVCSAREIAQLLQELGEELPKLWRDKLEKPARRPKPDAAPEAQAAAPEVKPKKQKPAPEGAGITVGKLRELLRDIPDVMSVLLDRQTPLTHLSFTRCYDAGSESMCDTLLLSPC